MLFDDETLIIQLIPAAPGLYVRYDFEDGVTVFHRVVAIALTSDERRNQNVIPLAVDDLAQIYSCEGSPIIDAQAYELE